MEKMIRSKDQIKLTWLLQKKRIKCSYKCINNQRRAKENLYLSSVLGSSVQKDIEVSLPTVPDSTAPDSEHLTFKTPGSL